MPNDDEEEIYHIHNVQGRTNQYLTDIQVSEKTVIFEIDTGVGASYKNLFKATKLMPTHAKLKAYSNNPLCVLGMLKVYGAIINKIHNQLNLYIIQ